MHRLGITEIGCHHTWADSRLNSCMILCLCMASADVRMRGFDGISGHHAWADSSVNVLSKVGFDGSVGSARFGGTHSHTCINFACTMSNNACVYIYICVMLVFE